MEEKQTPKKHKKSLKRFLRRMIMRFFSSRLFSDKASIKIKYFLYFGKRINLKNPVTFNEKANWMKLYYRKPIMTDMADKYAVKEMVSGIIGEEYVIPTIAIYDSWDELDFSKLKTPFVMKTNHSSGVIAVVKDYKDFDIKKTKKRFVKSLKENYFYHCREWPYKNIKPRIIIEQFIKDSKEDNLPVYKFFCFNGEPYLVQTIKNDKTDHETIDYFDMDWKLLNLTQNFANSDIPLNRPSNFDEMKKLAAKLSIGFPFVRVDLYSVDGHIYFSEFTFFSDAGYQRFHPDEWDEILGKKIILNTNEKFK